MRLFTFTILLLSLASRSAAQRGDSTIARIEKRGYYVASSFGEATAPFLAYKKNADGRLTISGDSPLYYVDAFGNLLPGGPYQYGSESFKKQSRVFAVKNALMGMIDRKGQAVVPFQFQKLEAGKHPYGWLRARLNGYWGLIDSTGRVQLQPKYDEMEAFSDGMAAVKKNGKWGFIDLAGHEVIAPVYHHVWRGFQEGFAAVDRSTHEHEEAVGFINKQNYPITEFKYAFPFCVNRYNAHFRDLTAYYQFRNGFALVRNSNCEVGVIDTQGREVLPVRFYRIEVTDSTVIGHRNKKQMTYRIPR